MSFENTEKRRNCSLRAISPFPRVFSTCLKNFLPFSNLKLSSANSFGMEESIKFVIWERVKKSEVVLHSNASKARKIWRIRRRMFLRIVGEYGP